jgi:hypothetical protein
MHAAAYIYAQQSGRRGVAAQSIAASGCMHRTQRAAAAAPCAGRLAPAVERLYAKMILRMRYTRSRPEPAGADVCHIYYARRRRRRPAAAAAQQPAGQHYRSSTAAGGH